ncbi:hypothetical protein GCM10023093_15360 [Nemorincola caseinilytica]|uniref:Probable membrane transporter protein n=1 Tax=Nemorincola caseinilytica TaxID=2054315 RepID=A0ABP8NEN4_9BACT
MEKYTTFLLLALVSEILGTVSGFGSSILFVPVASMFFDMRTVLGITAVFHVFSNISKITLFRKGIDRRIAVKLGIPAVLFVLLGAGLSTVLPLRQMELFMSVALILLSVYLLLNTKRTPGRTDTELYIGGAVSGFLAGLVGTGGAVRGLTLAAFGLSKDVFVATSALIDLGVDASRAVVYVGNGYFPIEYLILVPMLMLVAVVGSYLGKLVLQRTSERMFRYLVLGVIIGISVFQMVRYLTAQQGA